MVSGLNNRAPNYTTSIRTRMAVYDQMDSPQWTFGPYVIPTLASSNLSEGFDNASLIDVSLPVRRGHLRCELVPQGQLILNYTPWDKGERITTPDLRYGVSVSWPTDHQYDCYGSDIQIGKDGPFGVWGSRWNTHAPCPTSLAFYGTWVGKRAEELNVVLCWSSIQELQASLQFSMPDWQVRSLQVDERTMRTISSDGQTQLDLNGGIFNHAMGHISTSLDGSFSAFLSNSTTGIEDASLLQYNNFEDLYTRIQDVYGRATVSSSLSITTILYID
jgi:hypothetical protein